ncbi:uncharacterized protein [Rutidosis leptorrhynchoides]|uniref:uncharacterized protein n=1 Tax=Rutidosis leptorrhynchoides TaxID=125765 RepID=UPI003A98E24A
MRWVSSRLKKHPLKYELAPPVRYLKKLKEIQSYPGNRGYENGYWTQIYLSLQKVDVRVSSNLGIGFRRKEKWGNTDSERESISIVFDAPYAMMALNRSTTRLSLVVLLKIFGAVFSNGGIMEYSQESYGFVLVNSKDSEAKSKSILQKILTLYTNELPSMNYAANTGKKSTFLERCVSNGKYSTLVLKSKSEESPDEVLAAISFQIIQADTQYAEVPLAAVSSVYQHKGIGHLTYLEMRRRLQSVGVHSIFCWADVESEGFWLKQGFVSVGKVDTKGKARRLPVRADIRKALCFPGGSTLMVAHLQNECADNSAESLKLLSSLLKPIHKSSIVSMINSPRSGDDKVLNNNHTLDGCQDLVCLDSVECMNTEKSDANICSCSSLGARKRTWEASKTSLKSKKVKGGHLIVCQSDNGCLSTSNKTSQCSKDEHLENFTPTVGAPLSVSYDDNAQERNCYRIMLMNIADDAKKSNLTRIIKDLGGSVTSDGRESTHVVTGKVRKTLNFCTALCSGAWVISPAWLKESFRKGRFVDEMPYILKDVEYESKYRADLKDTVLKARTNPGGLLKGFEVCVATHVQPPINTLSAIVRSAGGNVIHNLHKVKDSSKVIFVASEDNMDEPLLAIKKGIPTFSNEWFMNCVMKQDLDLDASQFAESL